MDTTPYRVKKFGEKFGVVLGDSTQPIGRLYDDKSNAHRRKRKLNKDAQEIDEMIKRDGAIII